MLSKEEIGEGISSCAPNKRPTARTVVLDMMSTNVANAIEVRGFSCISAEEQCRIKVEPIPQIELRTCREQHANPKEEVSTGRLVI